MRTEKNSPKQPKTAKSDPKQTGPKAAFFGRRLPQRAFPNLDNDFHCIAVKAHDELQLLMYQPTQLNNSDVRRLTDLTNLLILVRKQSPKLSRKAKAVKATDHFDQLLDTPAEINPPNPAENCKSAVEKLASQTQPEKVANEETDSQTDPRPGEVAADSTSAGSTGGT